MLEDGTYDKDGLKIAYPDGYQVGLWDRPIEIPDGSMSLSQLINELTQTTEEFGAWTDSNGDFYVEPCVWIPDLDSALRIARALNQIAVWDWANMTEIRLKA
tara:strand:+ start:130 stop:435 length:306 start_codon:yes stop_codon:yes gene_type:complete